MWLLAYAWLGDTLTPGPGEPVAQVRRPVLELLSALPVRRVNLPDFASIMVGPVSHAEFAAPA